MLQARIRNRRKYLRVNTIFPLRFRFLDEEGELLSDWIGGFSHDVAKEGICVLSELIPLGVWQRIAAGKSRMELYINRPFSAQKMYGRGVVVWKETGGRLEREAKFYLGIKFDSNYGALGRKLVRQGRLKRILNLFVPLVITTSLIFSFLVWQENHKLIHLHQRYVQELLEANQAAALQQEELNRKKTAVNLLREHLQRQEERFKLIRHKLGFWQNEYRRALQSEKMLNQTQKEMSAIQEKKIKAEKKIAELQKELQRLSKENKKLTLALSKASAAQKKTAAAAIKADLRLAQTEQVSIEDMYEWIRVHQNLRTGLIASFEGDKNLADRAFTYDQALAAIVFTIMKNYPAAERILEFYLKRASLYRRGYLNAYYASGGDICEYIAHAGPNIWIGLASLNFIKATGNKKYLPIALGVAEFITSLQDKEGGIRGGPNVEWYSTEHNLDAYAFFSDLYLITHQVRYLHQAERILAWLKKYAYSRQSIPVNRGKGDATIATDTYAWSITAIGPEKLLSLGMDIDEIMSFALENCHVKTYFHRPEGEVELEGFDFAKGQNLARGGVVSSEWTSQMILAFEIMAAFYKEKGDLKRYNYYLKLARFYFNELKKMVVSSPSPVGLGRGVLVYASQANVDTGHGWRTPQGDRTGCIAGNAYYILSYYGYNPLNFSVRACSLKKFYGQQK